MSEVPLYLGTCRHPSHVCDSTSAVEFNRAVTSERHDRGYSGIRQRTLLHTVRGTSPIRKRHPP